MAPAIRDHVPKEGIGEDYEDDGGKFPADHAPGALEDDDQEDSDHDQVDGGRVGQPGDIAIVLKDHPDCRRDPGDHQDPVIPGRVRRFAAFPSRKDHEEKNDAEDEENGAIDQVGWRPQPGGAEDPEGERCADDAHPNSEATG
ncbi:MAG TPA: hypothetical protein VHL09_01135 [Dehalococcoidia bacterium]|nr:hypothetical protein [Dehalococcoidia bacterium]